MWGTGFGDDRRSTLAECAELVAAERTGCEMICVAMFDEVDEGMAIFRRASSPPVGDGVRFIGCGGLPSDLSLRLTGAGGRLLRGQIPISEDLPQLPGSRLEVVQTC